MDRERGSPLKNASVAPESGSGSTTAVKNVAALTARFSANVEKANVITEPAAKTDIRKRMFKSTESLSPSIATRVIDVEKPENSLASASLFKAANVADLQRALSQGPNNRPAVLAARSVDAFAANQTMTAPVDKTVNDTDAANENGVADNNIDSEYTNMAKSKLNIRPPKRRMPTRVTVADPLTLNPQSQQLPQQSTTSQNLPRPSTTVPSVATKPTPIIPPGIGVKLPANAVGLPRTALRPAGSNVIGSQPAKTVVPVSAKPVGEQLVKTKEDSNVESSARNETAVKDAAPASRFDSIAVSSAGQNEPPKSTAPPSSASKATAQETVSTATKRTNHDNFARVRVNTPKTGDLHQKQVDVIGASTGSGTGLGTSNRVVIAPAPAGRPNVSVTEKENEVTAKRSVKATVSLDVEAVAKKSDVVTRSDVISSLADRLMTPAAPISQLAATFPVGGAPTKRVPPAVSTKPTVTSVAPHRVSISGKHSGYTDTVPGGEANTNKQETTKTRVPVPSAKPPIVAPKTFATANSNVYVSLQTPGSVSSITPATKREVIADADTDGPITVPVKRTSVAERVRNLQQMSTKL